MLVGGGGGGGGGEGHELVRTLYEQRRRSCAHASKGCSGSNCILTCLLHGAESSFEKLKGFQPVKKFSEFYGTRMFITAVTSARRLSLT